MTPRCAAIAPSQAVSIFVILSFFFGPRGTSTVTTSLRFLPTRALPIGDSLNHGAEADLVGAERLLVDHGGAAQFFFQLRDPALEQRLFVLGVVVFGVLGDVAEFARLLDPRRDLAAFGRREELDFLFQILQPLWGDDRLTTHFALPRFDC